MTTRIPAIRRTIRSKWNAHQYNERLEIPISPKKIKRGVTTRDKNKKNDVIPNYDRNPSASDNRSTQKFQINLIIRHLWEGSGIPEIFIIMNFIRNFSTIENIRISIAIRHTWDWKINSKLKKIKISNLRKKFEIKKDPIIKFSFVNICKMKKLRKFPSNPAIFFQDTPLKAYESSITIQQHAILPVTHNSSKWLRPMGNDADTCRRPCSLKIT
jgi:hypothetical protein